jgi:hypothetical protein
MTSRARTFGDNQSAQFGIRPAPAPLSARELAMLDGETDETPLPAMSCSSNPRSTTKLINANHHQAAQFLGNETE